MAEISVEKLYTDFHKKVLSYISSRITNREDAEDLAADVFLKVQMSIDAYDENKASPSTWIYSITRNVVIDFFRTRKAGEELPDDLPAEGLIEEDYIRDETLSELADALEMLSEEERCIIVLHYYDGLPLTEIAAKLNMSYGMVKIRHNKALAALKKKMSR